MGNNGMGLLLPHTYHKCPNGPLDFIHEIINDHPTIEEPFPSCLLYHYCC